jgi:hypothetical protein
MELIYKYKRNNYRIVPAREITDDGKFRGLYAVERREWFKWNVVEYYKLLKQAQTHIEYFTGKK